MKGERLTHQESIFQQFISLVNSYSKTERNVGFYADKLCLTPPLPEHPHPADQPTNSNGLDKPVHYTRS